MPPDEPEVVEIEVDDIELVDAYFEPIYDRLKEMGVPEDRMPTTVQIVSHLMELVPDEYLMRWLEAYAVAESPLQK